MQRTYAQLAKLLLANHGKNKNGVLLTEYSNIPGLKVKASTTNGTSGTGVWDGQKVYWSYDAGMKWTAETGLVVDHHAPFFAVEKA